MKTLFEKIKESAMSVLPIVAIVLILVLTKLVELETKELIIFLVSTIFLIIGMALFNIGADLAMSPMGSSIGSGLAKRRKLFLLLIVAFVLGVLLTCAEPDLTVLAEQVEDVMNPIILKVGIAVGVGLFLIIAIIRIVFKKSLAFIMLLFYMLIFCLSLLVVLNGKTQLLPLSFDTGGVTAGPISFPFLMALGIGIANVLSGKNAKEDSFGIVALCSIGPILVVLFLSIFAKDIPIFKPIEADYISSGIIRELLGAAKEVAVALGLVVIFFLICQFTFLKLPAKKLRKIFFGILYTFFGLVIFLASVKIGYMHVGFKIGTEIATTNKVLLVPIGFLMGMIVVLAEPAVHVLKKQVEEITGGYITKLSMTIGLSIGVGLATALSMLRIIFPSFDLMYIVIPGYFLSLGLSLFVPRIYTAIAFDSGGVASGPMTSTFILPFSIGACCATMTGSVLNYAFGIVALVAMTPLITIQLLGFKAIVGNKVKQSIAMRRILSEDDEQIIDFM